MNSKMEVAEAYVAEGPLHKTARLRQGRGWLRDLTPRGTNQVAARMRRHEGRLEVYRHTLPPQVASDLHAARLSSLWSLTGLAAEIGISRGHLIRIQNGTRAPSSIVAIRLVDALDLNPEIGLGADLIRHSIAGVGHDRWL